MTKFYNYINEDYTGTLYDDISKKCKPYLNALTSSGTIDRFLVSGRKGKPDYFKGTVRTNREPRDTPIDIHNNIDELFYDKFGIRARSNTLFCAMTPIAVGTYGDPYFIFPIGQYKLIGSDEINDLYGDIIEDGEWRGYDHVEREIEDAMSTYKISKKLPDISKFHEIMLYCKKYYALNVSKYAGEVKKGLETEYNSTVRIGGIGYGRRKND